MTLLVLGVLLWAFAHLAKRILPGFHAAMQGNEKPMVAGVVIVAVALMVLGYRAADTSSTFAPDAMWKGVNNLLVLAAFYLFASSGAKNRLGTRMRHPQLIGFSLWAVGHLLVNRSTPDVVLFGGLLFWALAEIVLINRADPRWTPPARTIPVRKEITSALAAVVAFGVVGLIHGWIGPNPFGA